jgi:thiamine phosphate synthase YjbQ (UPF0047 family)
MDLSQWAFLSALHLAALHLGADRTMCGLAGVALALGAWQKVHYGEPENVQRRNLCGQQRKEI